MHGQAGVEHWLSLFQDAESEQSLLHRVLQDEYYWIEAELRTTQRQSTAYYRPDVRRRYPRPSARTQCQSELLLVSFQNSAAPYIRPGDDG